MIRKAVAAAVAAAVVAGAFAGAAVADDPGVSATAVLIGGTAPLSGEAAAFGAVAPGAKAYFDWVNTRGGVNGRTIEYRYYDDAYNPALTVQHTRRLVEEDHVLAIFNAVGTTHNLAIREYLTSNGVPQLFSADGSEALSASPGRYPWTIGFLAPYRGEGATYGRDLVATAPRAKVAVLLENSELGRDMERGLARAIAGRGPKVVASESYEFTAADVFSQVAKLRASGADTLMLLATPKFVIQAIMVAHKLGWKPRLYIASVSIEPGIMAIARTNAPELTNGARSIAFLKNPNDPVWAKDPVVALYRSILAAHAPAARPTDVYNWYGMTVAWTMVETLRLAGRELTRASLIKAARSLDTTKNPFLLPGIRIRTGPSDSRALDTLYLYRYDNKEWVKASGLLPAR